MRQHLHLTHAHAAGVLDRAEDGGRGRDEARFADALDRLQPILHNVATEGETWKRHGVTADKVLRLAGRIDRGAPALGAYARALVTEAVRRGYLAPAPDGLTG